MPLTVEIWSDVVCPWCYIGKRRFEAALAAFEHADEVTVMWRSFELDQEAPKVAEGTATERLAAKYGMSLERAQHLHAEMTERAAEEGLDFRFDLARGGNTFDAHRLIHLGREHGLQDEVKERLMRGYFCEREPIGDPEALERMAVDAGLPADEVREVLHGDRYADAVHADETAAAQGGIRGVPFFVLGRKYGLSGAQPADVIVQALTQTWNEQAAAAA